MALSLKRKNKILSALAQGHAIRRWWQGSNNRGTLRHYIEGFGNLKESEVQELRKAGLIEVDKKQLGSFKDFVLKV